MHDIARPHRSIQTEAYLENNNVRLLRQPAYSPDCNICDFYIFPRLESARKGNFGNAEDITSFLDVELPLITRQKMTKAVEELKITLQNIINNEGNYL